LVKAPLITILASPTGPAAKRVRKPLVFGSSGYPMPV
jgi:hypothetical protein